MMTVVKSIAVEVVMTVNIKIENDLRDGFT